MKLGAASGAMASFALWGLDFIRLAQYQLHQEAKLFAVHVTLGAALGVLVTSSLESDWSRLRRVMIPAGFVVTLGTLALLGMVGRYPQLLAEGWWLKDGFLAPTQVLITHTNGPRTIDRMCVALVLAAALVTLVRAVRRHRSRASKLAVALLLVGLARAAATRADVSGGAVNVLVVVSASLRADAIEDEQTMPYLASRIPHGSLHRYAVTPIARAYPAMVSMLTGTEPRTHGVRHRFPDTASRSDVGATLFTELRDRGYYTFAAGDAAAGVLSGFSAGFEATDLPRRGLASLERGANLSRHRFSLALLRFRWFRSLFPEWRNLPLLAEPEWVVDDALVRLESAGSRPFAGLVVLSTALEPYMAPYPPYQPDAAAYRGALTAIDAATERLLRATGDHTVVVVTGLHGETPGRARPGDTLDPETQIVPLLLLGDGVPEDVRSNEQVRLQDVPATVLEHLGGETSFGDGVSVLEDGRSRPVCVETGIWLDPRDGGARLGYPGISRLVTVDPRSDELVLRADAEALVETAKARGVILGNRLYREQPTENGLERETTTLDGLDASHDDTDVAALFDTRCVDGDDSLSRLYGTVVFAVSDRGER